MRISPETSQILLNALNSSDKAEQSALMQMTTGRRVNLASDDPAAAAVEVGISAQTDRCDQFLQSISSVSSELQTADSALNSAVSSLQRAVTLGVEGANGTLSQPDRVALASEIQGISQQMLSTANLSYNGKYVFAGTASTTAPYVSDTLAPGGVAYQGNDGVNLVETEQGDSIAVNQPGSQLFSSPDANVFVALNDLVTALQSPESTTSDLTDATQEVSAAYEHVVSARVFYGSTIDQLVSDQVFLNTEKLQLSQQMNDTVGVDMNQAATNLVNAQTARSAALAAASQTNNLSLLDYLAPPSS